jgi:hypothetical protein
VVDELSLIQKSALDSKSSKNDMIFGNSLLPVKYGSPSPVFLAKWVRLNKDIVKDENFDYMEPNYLKNFVVKVKK